MADIAGEGSGLPGKRSRTRDSLLLMGTIKAAGDYARERGGAIYALVTAVPP